MQSIPIYIRRGGQKVSALNSQMFTSVHYTDVMLFPCLIKVSIQPFLAYEIKENVLIVAIPPKAVVLLEFR